MEKNEFKELVYDAIIVNTDEETARQKSELASDLREEMLARVVEFDFLKKDGTVRHAFGTICPEFLPQTDGESSDKPKKDVAKNWGNFNYYDTEKKSWRSFNVVNLIGYEKGGDNE